MEQHVIYSYHNEIGHLGVDKVYNLITMTYWFPNLKQKIKNHIKNCLKCISYSPADGKKEGFLNNIPKGNLPFLMIHVDHYGPLQKTKSQNRYILVIVDGFTKFTKLCPCRTTNSKEVVKHLQNYFCTYSKPVRIVSDRGTCFTSNEFKQFLSDQNVSHTLIATGAPWANGQAERVNRKITQIL